MEWPELVDLGWFQAARGGCSSRFGINSMLICFAAVGFDTISTFLSLISGSSSLHVQRRPTYKVSFFGGKGPSGS